MRKKQTLVLLIVFAFINFGMLSLALFTRAKTDPTVFPLEQMAVMDLTHENFVDREINARLEPKLSAPIDEPAAVGDTFTFSVSDDGLGTDYDEEFRVVVEGEHILILITEDAYQEYLIDGEYYRFWNEYGTWGREWDLISPAQLEYLADEFDDNIYPTNTHIFGYPDSRPTNTSSPHYEDRDKIWTLIWNIKDWSYYDEAATYYIAGYFSYAVSNENDKNIMHIDSFDWANRIGPGELPHRAYLYEGTFAHEFQHLIHADQDADEPSWTDEACADLAMFMCGYGHSSGHIANYFNEHFWTPLTFWGSSLADYGASYLFALYLYEHFGGADFFTTLVQDPANGIEGVQNTLDIFAPGMTFEQVFNDWTIANYLDDPTPDSPYGYDLLDVGTVDTWGYTIEYILGDDWYGIPVIGSKAWPIPFGLESAWVYGAPPMPYTAHYWRFGSPHELEVLLAGDQTAGPYPHSGGSAWYSDVNAWAWRSFYQTFYIPPTGATLEFWTYFEIEDDWDYGYVEVFDGTDWYTLDTTSFPMVTDVAHPQDNPNCPDGREPSAYELAGEWHAFTGVSGDWIPITMDLSPFAGETIDLYFTTWQDGAFTLQMMYVDDISITGPDINFVDDVESGPDGWLTTGWDTYKCYEFNNWHATVIETLWQPTKRYAVDQNWHARKLLNEWPIVIDYGTQIGTISDLPIIPADSRHDLIVIVSNCAPHILPADYWIQFTYA